MLDKMKQLMEMKRQAEELKKQLEATLIEVSDVKGIAITIDGAQNFKSIQIDSVLVQDNNKAALEAGLLKAVNAAIAKSQRMATQKMQEMTGLNIPGM